MPLGLLALTPFSLKRSWKKKYLVVCYTRILELSYVYIKSSTISYLSLGLIYELNKELRKNIVMSLYPFFDIYSQVPLSIELICYYAYCM